MNASFYDLLKYAATGIASPGMTHYDKMRALAMTGGGTIKTLTGIPPLSFTGNGKPLISLSMLGNTQQTGTPSPDNIIMPTFCGKLVDTGWKIPITCAGQTVPVYLGQTQTVRKIRKFKLETPAAVKEVDGGYQLRFVVPQTAMSYRDARSICNIAAWEGNNIKTGHVVSTKAAYITQHISEWETLEGATAWFAERDVYIWYVLAEPETAIVNEPLCKIGDYADELHSTDAAVTIPTANGDNTLTVDTDLQPSSMTITGHIE